MARHTIHRHLFLLVALDAISHRQVHFSLGHCLRGHITVACRALDARANMRRMIEFHVGRRLKVVDALPGNVLASRPVCSHFLDLGLIFGDYLVASHAEIDARNPCVRSLVDPYVAIHALETIGQMNFMRKGDWLDGRGP